MHLRVCFSHAIGCAAVLAGALAASAQASIIEIVSDTENSLNQTGHAHGFIEYAATTATLTITLTNTSAPGGSPITAFLFNINSQDQAATASLTSSTHAFQLISGNAPGFGGPYPAGAAVGNNWSGGGSPHNGIAVGVTGIFVFNVLASDSASLNASSFITGDLPFNFVVRFRGFGPGDKVPMIPAPATAGLLVLGALCGVRRRRSD